MFIKEMQGVCGGSKVYFLLLPLFLPVMGICV